MNSFFKKLSLFFLMTACAAAIAEDFPLNFRSGANTSFRDEAAGDKKGGWTDQGGNDLRVMIPGNIKCAGVEFRILGDKEENGKSCIVVGKHKECPNVPAEAELKFEKPVSGKILYLLHAGAWVPSKKDVAGNLKLVYADGSSESKHIRNGRELCDWWSAGGHAKNAVRAWSKYNNNSQVSLFVSKFPLKKALKGIRFEANKGVWMIAAATLGDDRVLAGIRVEKKIRGTYQAPERYPAGALRKIQKNTIPRNIILIIGDGMGQNAIRLSSLYAHGNPGMLVMEQLPVNGMATTFSANSAVTDSAASGTALSCGFKTNNGMLGMNPNKKSFQSIASEAKNSGRLVGIITTDALTGATPSAFFAHVQSRAFAADIAEWAAQSGFDILIGNKKRTPFLPEGRKDGKNLVEVMAKIGYADVKTPADIANAKARMFGTIGYPGIRTLAEISASAFEKLGKNPKGFFCMVESSYPDGGGHANNPDLSILGTLMTDHVVKAAVDYALKHGDTLVVVTADHETGGLFVAANKLEPKKPFMVYTTTQHTGVPVDVFAAGPSSEKYFNGVVDNTDIPKAFAQLWSLKLGQELAR